MKKTLKRRTFISAIAMLLVSAIVLTSSTFAWFSMARQVGVQEMELTVTSPEGIQISANTANWTTQITMEDLNPTDATTSRFKADADHTNYFPALLRPSSSRLVTFSALPTFFEGNVSEAGIVTLTQKTDATGGYVCFDVFLKVSETQTVYWDDTSVSVVENGNEEVLYATRVALLPLGTSEDPTVAKTLLNITNGRAQMYEPAGYKHLAELIDAGKASDDTYVSTNYIARAGTQNVLNTGYVVTDNQLAMGTLAGTLANEKDKTGMKFTATPGISRVRVYLWIEGNDIDCLQSVGGSQLKFALNFSLDA